MPRKTVINAADEIAAARLYECGFPKTHISRIVNLRPEQLETILTKYEGRSKDYRKAVSGLPLMPRRWTS